MRRENQPADNGKPVGLATLHLLTEANWEVALETLVDRLSEIDAVTGVGLMAPSWYFTRRDDKHFVFTADLHEYPEGHPRRGDMLRGAVVDIRYSNLQHSAAVEYNKHRYFQLWELPVTLEEIVTEAEKYCRGKLKDVQRGTSRLICSSAPNRLERDEIETLVKSLKPFHSIIVERETREFLQSFGDYSSSTRSYKPVFDIKFEDLSEEIVYALDTLGISNPKIRGSMIKALPFLVIEANR